MFPQIHIQLEFQIITLYGNRVSADVACYYEVILDEGGSYHKESPL